MGGWRISRGVRSGSEAVGDHRLSPVRKSDMHGIPLPHTSGLCFRRTRAVVVVVMVTAVEAVGAASAAGAEGTVARSLRASYLESRLQHALQKRMT